MRSGAKYRREQLKPLAALVVRRGADAAGANYFQLGLRTGDPKQQIGRMASPRHREALDMVRARLSPAPVAKEVARFVVEPHGALVIDAPVVIECTEAERTYRLTREANDLANVRAENLRDGSHNLAEAEAELKELREDIAAKLEHEAHLVALIAKLRGSR